MFRHETGPARAAAPVPPGRAPRCSAWPRPSIDAELIAMLVAMLERDRASPPASWRWPSTPWASPRSGSPTGRRCAPTSPSTATRSTRTRSGGWRPTRCASSTRRTPRCRRCAPARPVLLDTLGEASRDALRGGARRCWRRWAASSEVDPRLVRGLDYYTGTIFEIRPRAGNLGSQNTLAGGGRYDRLVRVAGRPGHAGAGLRHGHRAGAAGADRRATRASSRGWRCSSPPWARPPAAGRCRWPTGCACAASGWRSSTATPA